MGLFSGITYWVGQRNLWKGRADSAWGASRVWNSGASWETNYNAEVTLYNNEVALYNSVLPPAAADQIIGTTINTGLNGGGSGMTNADELVRITIDRTGYWAFAGYAQCGASGDGDTVWLTIYSGGTTLGSTTFGFTPNHGVNSAGSGVFASPALLSAGAVVSLYGVKNGAQQVPTLTQQGLRGWFMPTQANAH